jgi:membrane associated rhomboid family serine protease
VARRGGGLPRLFTFGDRIPASLGLVLALTLAMSVWGWLDRTRTFAALMALSPEGVLRGQLWRLVSWPFVERDPLDLAFAGIMLYGLGQQLAFAWSERRFLSRFFGYAAFATVGTTLVALAWPPLLDLQHVGMWPVVNAFIVSWGMLFPDRQVNLFFVLPITGRMMAWLVLGGTFLYGIAAGGLLGILAFTPHLFAIGAAWALAHGGVGAGRRWRDARAWWAEQSARRRSRHLKVVKRDGEQDRPRWLN